jgi:hypothetical protein
MFSCKFNIFKTKKDRIDTKFSGGVTKIPSNVEIARFDGTDPTGSGPLFLIRATLPNIVAEPESQGAASF